jgi:hypothetical protein
LCIHSQILASFQDFLIWENMSSILSYDYSKSIEVRESVKDEKSCRSPGWIEESQGMFMFMSSGWDCLSELWPLVGLFIPEMICAYGEPQWNDIDGKCEEPVPLSLCPPQITWCDPALCGERLATNHVSHGMALGLRDTGVSFS